jgi:hypothetical protein
MLKNLGQYRRSGSTAAGCAKGNGIRELGRSAAGIQVLRRLEFSLQCRDATRCVLVAPWKLHAVIAIISRVTAALDVLRAEVVVLARFFRAGVEGRVFLPGSRYVSNE